MIPLLDARARHNADRRRSAGRACLVAALATLLALGVGAQEEGKAVVEERRETRDESRGSREILFRGGEIVEERLSSPDGTLLEEVFRRAGGESETVSYLRSGGKLARAEARDATGAIVGAIDYRYDRNGRLLGVAASGSLGSDAAGMVSTGGSPTGTWTSSTTKTSVVTYDGKGRPLAIHTARGGSLASVEKRLYASGPGPASSEIEDRAAGTFASVEYDSAGRPVVRIEYVKGSRKARIEYGYDAAGKLILERTARAGSTVERILSYEADGALAREETRKDGLVQSVAAYSGDDKTEEQYLDGVLFVRATYRGGRKVKDEFYFDGAPVRTKDY